MKCKQLSVAAVLLLGSLAAHADTATFDFTYISTSGDVAGETASGMGSFSVHYTPGMRTGTLSAFSFTDTINSSVGDSTFSYSGVGSVASSEIVLTLSGEGLARALFTTNPRLGTDPALGPADFSFQDILSVVSENTSSVGGAGAPDSRAANTTGGGSVTFASAVTPEPSTFALLGTGLLGGAGVLKRRFHSMCLRRQ